MTEQQARRGSGVESYPTPPLYTDCPTTGAAGDGGSTLLPVTSADLDLDLDPSSLYSRAELLGRGLSKSRLTSEVASGALLRIRRGVYAAPSLPVPVVTAVRVGGRLACTSALATAGAWVRDRHDIHIHLDRAVSRPRSPRSADTPLTRDNRLNCVVHWRRLVEPEAATDVAVGAVDALIQTAHCQPVPFAVAAFDSALRLGLIRHDQLDIIFWRLPNHLRHLRELIDPRSESIIETVFRLLLRDARIDFEVQVPIHGVGRVDFVVGGRLIVETDGEEFHGAAAAERDYDRDLAAAELGYAVIRLNYRQVMFEPERVVRAVRAALRAHRRVGSER